MGRMLETVSAIGQCDIHKPGLGMLGRRRSKLIPQWPQEPLQIGHCSFVHRHDHSVAAAEIGVDRLTGRVGLGRQATNSQAQVPVLAIDPLCCIEQLTFLVHRSLYSRKIGQVKLPLALCRPPYTIVQQYRHNRH